MFWLLVVRDISAVTRRMPSNRHSHDVVIYDNVSTGYKILADGFELISAILPMRASSLPSCDASMP